MIPGKLYKFTTSITYYFGIHDLYGNRTRNVPVNLNDVVFIISLHEENQLFQTGCKAITPDGSIIFINKAYYKHFERVK